ncbi:hypothetical protein V2J09_006402 [Rumex salicifolius]
MDQVVQVPVSIKQILLSFTKQVALFNQIPIIVNQMKFGCPAFLTIRLDVKSGAYKYVSLEERHNHGFVLDKDKQFLSSRRKFYSGHKKFVMDCEKANIGPVRLNYESSTMRSDLTTLWRIKEHAAEQKKDSLLSDCIGGS